MCFLFFQANLILVPFPTHRQQALSIILQYLEIHVVHDVIFFMFLDKKLPLLVFGVLSIVGGFLALPLPETRHRPLPETIDDVEHYEEFCRFVLV